MVVQLWQKQVFDLLFFLIVIFTWRFISCSNSPSCFARCSKGVQKVLHILPLTWLFQWYTLLFMVFSAFMIWDFKQLIIHDYIRFDFLNPELIEDSWTRAAETEDISQQYRYDCAIPRWLAILSMTAPVVGALAFLILLIHAVRNIQHLHCYRKTHGFKAPWKPDNRQDMVLLIIVVPAVFILMSIRSIERMWMVMMGVHTGRMAVTDVALYDENFELASICQYYLVFVFTELCFSFLNDQHADAKFKTAFHLLGFQGVYSWVLIGIVHSGLVFFSAYFGHHGMTTEQKLQAIEATERVGTFASAFSLLCTYNMLIVCKLPWVNKALNNASMKFNGTKILLLLGPNQLKIIDKLKKGGGLPEPLQPLVKLLNLSDFRGRLLHASLLCFECLIVVLLNRVTWGNEAVNVGKSAEDEDNNQGSKTESLLPN